MGKWSKVADHVHALSLNFQVIQTHFKFYLGSCNPSSSVLAATFSINPTLSTTLFLRLSVFSFYHPCHSRVSVSATLAVSSKPDEHVEHLAINKSSGSQWARQKKKNKGLHINIVTLPVELQLYKSLDICAQIALKLVFTVIHCIYMLNWHSNSVSVILLGIFH
jgi:hypothetical protein